MDLKLERAALPSPSILFKVSNPMLLQLQKMLRNYGDHPCTKRDYDEAMAQYIHTIGHLKPSCVIQKLFLDAPRICNVTSCVRNSHEKVLIASLKITPGFC